MIADEELSAAQARIVARMRVLMLISAATTMIGIAVVAGVIGYRIMRGDGRVLRGAQSGLSGLRPEQSSVGGEGSAPVEVTAQLPKGSRVIATAAAGDRIIVTVDIGGMLEVRTFDARTLRPEGRLRFETEP